MLTIIIALLAIRLAAAGPVGSGGWEYPSLEDWQEQPEIAEQGHAIWSSMQDPEEGTSSQRIFPASVSEPVRRVIREQQNTSDNTEEYYNRVLAEAARDPTYTAPQGLPSHMYWDLFKRKRDRSKEKSLAPLRRKSHEAHMESEARLREQRERAPDYSRYYNEDGSQYNEEIQQFIRDLMSLHIPIDVIYEYVWAGIEDGQIDDLKTYAIICEERWRMTPYQNV